MYTQMRIVGLVQWAQATQLTVELVYYPPYHSKYNPIERCWGVLEVYWNGEPLDSEEAVLGFAANMTYAGRHPYSGPQKVDHSGHLHLLRLFPSQPP